METAKNQSQQQATQASVCARTQTRTESCACGACARRVSANTKYATNKRDVHALLDLIAGCVDCHPRVPQDAADWGDVGDIAHLRERLMAIAVGFALGADLSETNARRRLEDALCTEDEHVAGALIDSM